MYRQAEMKNFMRKVVGFKWDRTRTCHKIISDYAENSEEDHFVFSIKEIDPNSNKRYASPTDINYDLEINHFISEKLDQDLVTILNETTQVPYFLAKYKVEAYEKRDESEDTIQQM